MPKSFNFNGRITNLWIFDVALHLDQINAMQFLVEAPADECSCYNGGSCSPRDDGYMCICHAGYIGEYCEWQKQGCYHEVWPRKSKAMGEHIGKFKENRKDIQAAVEACLKAAQEKQLEIFGVRRRYKCVTTKTDSPADFDRYGSSVTCKEQGDYGVGIKTATFVYILKKGE
ncbi:hypothetical protein OS493_001052 [Desmophyllum pertusum]|uniref:EGF-like domain-containing protein n=1 Tax=Desmophyllum pertusum TaxID=174260 RepID=A0A9W9ZUH8_9CNID|nr:hypothetical protein OS493_001052 [Desmophyllum pertusum]